MSWWPFSRAAKEAHALKEQAQEGLEDAREKKQEVREVAASLREMREKNHFADHVERLIRGTG